MKKVFLICFGLLLTLSAACAAGTGKMNSDTSQGQLSPEALTAKAEAKYSEYLGANAGNRKEAAEKTATYLRDQPGVKEVTVRGGNLFVIFQDGNELLLMLGKDRI